MRTSVGISIIVALLLGVFLVVGFVMPAINNALETQELSRGVADLLIVLPYVFVGVLVGGAILYWLPIWNSGDKEYEDEETLIKRQIGWKE